MNAPTSIQVINGPDGKPAFVVIPYLDYLAIRTDDSGTVPHDVVSRTVDGATPARAWREHLSLTQGGCRPAWHQPVRLCAARSQ
jgi:hypothetical protein